MIAFAIESYEAASKVIIEWGNNSMELDFSQPVLTMAEISDAVRKRFPGVRPIGQFLSKGVCRVVFRESDFSREGVLQ